MADTLHNNKLSAEELKRHFLAACELQENNRIHDALGIYKELERFIPTSALLHFNMGLAMFDLQDFDKAEGHYCIAARENPGDPDIHYNRGLNFRRLNRNQDAALAFAQAVEQGDSSVDTIYNMALCHQDSGEFSKAASFYDIVLAKDPDHLATLNNYAYLCHKSNDLTKAEELYRQLLQLNPEHEAAQHMLNSLLGKTPDTAPLHYIESVFDSYAETFEENLLQDLCYQTPTELWQQYRALFPDTNDCRCLDLGCGTGLAAEAFSPACRTLTGVDISTEILKVAEKKNLYRKVFQNDILSFLDQTQDSFDLIIAADVFTYMGDLEPVFRACADHTDPDGILCFSVEESQQDTFMLKKSGRFGHSPTYLEGLCRKTGWSILACRHSKLRQDKKEWILGYLFILQKG